MSDSDTAIDTEADGPQASRGSRELRAPSWSAASALGGAVHLDVFITS